MCGTETTFVHTRLSSRESLVCSGLSAPSALHYILMLNHLAEVYFNNAYFLFCLKVSV